MFAVFNAVPARFNIALMMFLACWMNYMTRVNISIIIIAMVFQNTTTISMKSECDALKNNTDSEYSETFDFSDSRNWRQREGLGIFDWTAQEQAYVLSSYFWGYTLTSFIGGTVVEIIGSRLLVLAITLVCGLGDLLSPQAANLHYIVLVIVRFVIGAAACLRNKLVKVHLLGVCGFQGMLFPGLNHLMVRWAPPDERGLFVSSMLGGAIGTVFTWSLIGPLIDRFGWDIGFYVSGTTVILWSLIWWYLVYDSPIKHPRISDTEKEYILKEIGDDVVQSSPIKPRLPIRDIFTSFPFLAMIVLHFGNGWGFYFVMTAAPKYVSTALGFNLGSTGILSSLPYLARMSFSLVFGAIGDRIIRTNKVSTKFIRKFFCLFSHIVPGLLLIALGYTGCAPILSIALITFTLGFNGAAALTDLVNHVDLAPNFAGTLYGISNGISTVAGFVTPLVTAHFTKNGNSFAEWRPVFLTGGSVYIGTAIYFIVFGSAKIQPWNNIVISGEDRQPEKDVEPKCPDK